MTDTNQKLREVATELDRLMLVIESAVRNADPRNHASVMALIFANKEALALPTADHLPDAGEMINGLTQAETDASASVSGLTAAPGGEREAFEQFAQNCPMGKYNVARRGEGYDSSHTQIMWDAWQARAALSAGDAVDAQRYRLARRGQHFSVINGIGDTLRGEALDAAADAVMRKGQL